MYTLTVTAHNRAQFSTPCPVTGGVPIAEGAAPEGTRFHLSEADGQRVPLQTEVLARWKDGSARWVLLDFQSASGTQEYTLAWDGGAPDVVPEMPVQLAADGEGLAAGSVQVAPVPDGLLRLSDRLDLVLTLTDGDGKGYRARPASTTVETAGPMRSTLRLVGDFCGPDGGRFFQFQLRVSVYAGCSRVRLEPLILVDNKTGILQHVRDLRLALTPVSGSASVRLCGGWSGEADAGVRVFQYDDQHWRMEGADGSGDRAEGWAEVDDGQGPVALALQDFWQQWPKSLEADAGGLSLGLFPAFEADAYAHMEPWYKYQYLFEGAQQ